MDAYATFVWNLTIFILCGRLSSGRMTDHFYTFLYIHFGGIHRASGSWRFGAVKFALSCPNSVAFWLSSLLFSGSGALWISELVLVVRVGMCDMLGLNDISNVRLT